MIRLLAGIIILVLSGALLWFVFVAPKPQSEPTQHPASQNVSRETNWYPIRDWADSQPGNMNISVFVYRDRNRDGIYDPQDLPMAAVAILLERPDGTLRMVRTNINGYANFSVKANSEESDIGTPDQDYVFAVQAPPGWQVTSNNTRQGSRFSLLHGTPAGMVTEAPPKVIGLAPDLTISGRITPESLSTGSFVAHGPNGEELSIASNKEGEFNFYAQPGPWRLILKKETRVVTVHEFEMRDAPVVLGTIDASVTLSPLKPVPLKLSFDDFQRSVIEKLANGYGGLNWDYLLAIDNQHYQGPGYVNVLTSGHAVGYNSSGYPVTVSSNAGQRFDFTGAYFAVAWPPAEGEILNVEGWRDQRRVYSDSLHLSHLGPVWFQADYREIDRLRLHTPHYWQFTTDDMLYRLNRVPTSP